MNPAGQGRFITFEGGEGAGKSTQASLLATHLRNAGIEVVTTREPGGTPEAEAVRTLLFGTQGVEWDAAEEVLLIFAARHAHIRTLIRPALDRGAWVLCDRFGDSTRAYQGYGHGVPDSLIDEMETRVLEGMRPDRTLLFDLPVEDGIARARARQQDGNRYDRADLAFHKRVAAGFDEIADADPGRVRRIDATGTVEQVRAAVLDALEDLLPPSLHGPG